MKNFKKYLKIFIFLCIFSFPFLQVKADDRTLNIDYNGDYVKKLLNDNYEYLEMAHELADYYKDNQLFKYVISVFKDKVYFVNLYNCNRDDFFFIVSIGDSASYVSSSPEDYGFYSYVEISKNNFLTKDEYITILNKGTANTKNTKQYIFPFSYIYRPTDWRNTSFNMYDDSYLNESRFNASIIYEAQINYKFSKDSYDVTKIQINNDNYINKSEVIPSYVDVMSRFTIEDLPQEPTSNLYSINTLASLTNDFITNLQENNISFYLLLISLFIFNVILYIIRAIICDM